MQLDVIYNENCLEGMKKLPDESVDLILTDPPYGMNYQCNTRTEKFPKMMMDDSVEWFGTFAEQIYRVLKNNSHAYIFCDGFSICHFRNEAEKVGFSVKKPLVWVKDGFGTGDLAGDYCNVTELILFAHKGRRELNGRRDKNVLTFRRLSNLLTPTQKPVPLFRFLIQKSSSPGDIVLDPFMGSGTTAIACKKVERHYIGFEVNKEYYEISQKRLSQLQLELSFGEPVY